MTKEQLAAQITGREAGNELTYEEEQAAKQAGLFVIFGYSDDCTEIRGACNDELSCFDGGEFCMNRYGPILVPDDLERETLARFKVLDLVLKGGREIKALWEDGNGWTWSYATDIPHVTFEVFEDGEQYCRGIIIDSKDLQ